MHTHLRTALLTAAALAPAPALAELTGGIEFSLGFADSLELDGLGRDGDNEQDRTLGITPSLEKHLGSVVALGFEWMFLWFADDPEDAERHLIMSPHARIRMSFPLAGSLSFDGLLGVGPTIWTGLDEVPGPLGDTRFGWSLRFAFGLGYAINKSVAVFGNAGYYTSTSYGDDLEATYSTVPVGLGLRGTF